MLPASPRKREGRKEIVRTLVIETATAACSVALIEDGAVIARAHEVVGRGHAERLIPMIAALPGQGRAEQILVDVGPGSFTGVRVGLAAAKGLAIGWGAEACGFSSTFLLAAVEFDRNPGLPKLAVVIEGGHGEVFMQSFARPQSTQSLSAETPLRSLAPPEAIAALDSPGFGSGARRLLALDASLPLQDALPDAADALLLGDLARLPPRPIYGRAPDAKPMAGTDTLA
jgi:tRNA threonylcarbamoyl adenosine modification protein YeaZ